MRGASQWSSNNGANINHRRRRRAREKARERVCKEAKDVYYRRHWGGVASHRPQRTVFSFAMFHTSPSFTNALLFVAWGRLISMGGLYSVRLSRARPPPCRYNVAHSTCDTRHHYMVAEARRIIDSHSSLLATLTLPLCLSIAVSVFALCYLLDFALWYSKLSAYDGLHHLFHVKFDGINDKIYTLWY